MGIKGKRGIFVDKILKHINSKNSKNLEIPLENNILNWRFEKNNEFYVDDVIEPCIASGLKVRVFEADRYVCWGTPEDYQTYNYWSDYFKNKQ